MEPAGEVEKLGGEVEPGRLVWMRCELSQMTAGWERDWAMGGRTIGGRMKGGRMMGEQGLGEEVLPQLVLEWAETSVELFLVKRVRLGRLRDGAWRLLSFPQRAGVVAGWIEKTVERKSYSEEMVSACSQNQEHRSKSSLVPCLWLGRKIRWHWERRRGSD